MKRLSLLLTAIVLISALPAAAQIETICGISTWGWLWEYQALGTVGAAQTNLTYVSPFYARYGSTSLSGQLTVNGVGQIGVPVTFAASTLWGGLRSAYVKTGNQGIARVMVNWPADVYEMVVKSADGSASAPAALTIYNSALNTTYAGGALILGAERRRATFGMRYGTTPTVTSGLLFLDPGNPRGPTRITSTSFRRIASPAGTRKYVGVCTFSAPWKAPEGANLFVTTSTQTTGYTLSIKVVAVSMEVYYDVSARTVNSGAKWGP